MDGHVQMVIECLKHWMKRTYVLNASAVMHEERHGQLKLVSPHTTPYLPLGLGFHPCQGLQAPDKE